VDPSNIGKFYGGANTPVGLGKNGSIPTGSIPTFYIEYSPMGGLVNLGSSLIRFVPFGSLVAGTTYNGTGAGFANWSQLGGDIVGVNGSYFGMIQSTDPSNISMSANGKLVCVGQNSYPEYIAGKINIIKFDDAKTTAPAKWTVSQLSSTLLGFGTKVVLSGDGNTLVAYSNSVSQVFSTTDGGTTWTQKGADLSGKFVSTSISANGSIIVAVVSNVLTIYTWDSVSWVSSASIGGGNLVAISGDGKIINKVSGRDVSAYSLNASTGLWNSIAFYSDGLNVGLDGAFNVSTSFDGSLLTVIALCNAGELRLFRRNGSSFVNLIDQKVLSYMTYGAANYYPFAAKLSYTGSFIIGGMGRVGVYDIISNGAITYTSSNSSVADLYGNAVFMKTTGTSTITATQTTATGTGTTTGVLTVV
jgi:hypothetical protein